MGEGTVVRGKGKGDNKNETRPAKCAASWKAARERLERIATKRAGVAQGGRSPPGAFPRPPFCLWMSDGCETPDRRARSVPYLRFLSPSRTAFRYHSRDTSYVAVLKPAPPFFFFVGGRATKRAGDLPRLINHDQTVAAVGDWEYTAAKKKAKRSRLKRDATSSSPHSRERCRFHSVPSSQRPHHWSTLIGCDPPTTSCHMANLLVNSNNGLETKETTH